WYVTQAMRSIYETSASQSDIDRRLRELIEYMGWKSGWETLQAYQHYFDPQRHSEIQDRLHQRLDAALKNDLARRSDGRSMPAAVMMAGRFDVTTIINRLSNLNTRFTLLFEALGLSRMEDWSATTHIPAYLKSEVLPNETLVTRHRFWVDYNSASKTMASWLRSLSDERRPTYQRFTLPVVPL